MIISTERKIIAEIRAITKGAADATFNRLIDFPWVSVGGPGTANARVWEDELRDRILVEEWSLRLGAIDTLRKKLARIRGEEFLPLPRPVMVIIPCGKSKTFTNFTRFNKLQKGMKDRKEDGTALVRAMAAYTSRLFGLNLLFALKYGDTFRILSAKYGFLQGHDFIEDYDATFNSPGPGVISDEELRRQASQIEWAGYHKIIILGGKQYRDKLAAILPQRARERVCRPLAGLDLPQMHKALTEALSNPMHKEMLQNTFDLPPCHFLTAINHLRII